MKSRLIGENVAACTCHHLVKVVSVRQDGQDVLSAFLSLRKSLNSFSIDVLGIDEDLLS